MPTPVQPSLPGLSQPAEHCARWFSTQGCVVREGEVCSVFVGGLLLGRYSKEELGPRNVLLCLLSQDRAMHKGRLAEAFDVSVEMLRLLRQC